ncbi:MAG: acyl-CoA thioesterase [Haloarculaceae archaeon]
MDVFECTVPIRFSDVDAAGVVNNAAYVTVLEEARVAFARDVVGVDALDEFPFVVAALDVDYRHPIRELADITVTVEVTDIGESSFTLDYELRVDEQVIATAETVQVAVDLDTGESRPIPDRWRERLTA